MKITVCNTETGEVWETEPHIVAHMTPSLRDKILMHGETGWEPLSPEVLAAKAPPRPAPVVQPLPVEPIPPLRGWADFATILNSVSILGILGAIVSAQPVFIAACASMLGTGLLILLIVHAVRAVCLAIAAASSK